LAKDSQAFLDELVWLPLIGGGEIILRAFCSSDLWQIYQTLYLFFRMQKCGFTTPSQEVGMQLYNSFSGCRNAVLSMGDGILSPLPWVSRPYNRYYDPSPQVRTETKFIAQGCIRLKELI
jgi:hypothetical protein